jgi:arginine exporter protein ArgO
MSQLCGASCLGIVKDQLASAEQPAFRSNPPDEAPYPPDFELLQPVSPETHVDDAREVVLTCLAIPWLNPHVYLDRPYSSARSRRSFRAPEPHPPPAR